LAAIFQSLQFKGPGEREASFSELCDVGAAEQCETWPKKEKIAMPWIGFHSSEGVHKKHGSRIREEYETALELLLYVLEVGM
jgi:hypothetical protein